MFPFPLSGLGQSNERARRTGQCPSRASFAVTTEIVDIALWTRKRRALLPLFQLADDSPAQIRSYLDQGEILVARPEAPIGHVQLIAGSLPAEVEIRSLAVAEEHQRVGIGTRLMEAAAEHCKATGASRLTVSTAASSLAALRFYLRRGFRVFSVVRDAFSPATGYGEGLKSDGLAVNDALVLHLEI